MEDDVECWLLNAQHLKNVPGRKTDLADAAWIAQLVEHGLVRPSFEVAPPDPGAAGARPAPARRCSLSAPASPSGSRKLLEDAGTRAGLCGLGCAGVWGRAMLEGLVGGTTDPEVLAALARGRLGNQLPALRAALQGRVARHTGCWWPSCWRTWTTWTRRSSD